ncbi:SDR family NAD(P)-dependent oxidoreductase, partial [Lacticaseibacillus rhamnosus]
AVERGALTGKTAVITGANRGVGKAIAEAFARAGACAICVVRDRERGESVVSRLKAEGLKSDIGVADVGNPAQVAVLALDVAQRHPAIDILVNNAGIFLAAGPNFAPAVRPLAAGGVLPPRLFRAAPPPVALPHASIVAPFLLGAALALVLYPRLSSSDVSFTSFALFVGVAMSITATSRPSDISVPPQVRRSSPLSRRRPTWIHSNSPHSPVRPKSNCGAAVGTKGI